MSFPQTGADGPIRIAYVVNKLATGGVKSLLTSYLRISIMTGLKSNSWYAKVGSSRRTTRE